MLLTPDVTFARLSLYPQAGFFPPTKSQEVTYSNTERHPGEETRREQIATDLPHLAELEQLSFSPSEIFYSMKEIRVLAERWRVHCNIVERQGDYAPALKANQGTRHDDAVLLLDAPELKASRTRPLVEADHGRIETRTATVSTEIGWLQKQHQWPGLKAIGKVERVREIAEKATSETAYYLLSSELTPERFNEVVRQHWNIENSLHWQLDVVMNEDQNRTRAGNGAHNLAVLQHSAINAMQKEGSKGSLRGKFKRGAWNDDFLSRLLEMF